MSVLYLITMGRSKIQNSLLTKFKCCE